MTKTYNENMNTISTYDKAGLSFVEITNNNGFKVIFCDFGASIYRIIFDGKDMCPQVLNEKDFCLEQVRFGKTIGRVSGRIANHQLIINGNKYELSNNNNGITIHGGHDSLQQRKFAFDIKNNENCTEIIFKYLSPHLESGFPGNLKTTVTYIVPTTEDYINVQFDSVSDQLTPISLTNHIFFSLGDRDVYNLKLCVNADKYIYPDPKDLMALEVRDIIPPLNFIIEREIAPTINDPLLNVGCINGYDHYVLFSNKNEEHQIKLSNDKYELYISTDFEGATLYSDNNRDSIDVINSSNHRRRGLAIEPQVSHLRDILKKPGEHFSGFIKYSFKKK